MQEVPSPNIFLHGPYSFAEYYPLAWRAAVMTIQRNLSKPGFDPINNVTQVILPPSQFDLTETGLICYDNLPGFPALYDHAGGFGNQSFWLPFTETYFNGESTNANVPGAALSPATVTVFGRTSNLTAGAGDNNASGSVNVFVSQWRTFDGIWDPGDGSQVIFPVPTGLSP